MSKKTEHGQQFEGNMIEDDDTEVCVHTDACNMNNKNDDLILVKSFASMECKLYKESIESRPHFLKNSKLHNSL